MEFAIWLNFENKVRKMLLKVFILAFRFFNGIVVINVAENGVRLSVLQCIAVNTFDMLSA